MRFYFPYLMLVGLAVGGCGVPAGPETTTPGALVLQIHLPSALSRTERRRETFLRRVNRLELSWTTQSGRSGSHSYPPGQWEQMALPETGFPEGESDRLHLSVRVWDSNRDGTPRLVPALSGKVLVKGEERAKQGPTNIHLRVSLRVPVAEYD